MSVKIRLQRHGRKKAPFYHIVIADARSPRDGKFIEKIGTYNPLTKPATIDLDRDAAYAWLTKGAQPTETVAAILRFKGVMYRKHLQRGVSKGAMTQEKADELFAAWVAAKDSAVETRRETTLAEKMDMHKRIFGTPKAKKVVEVPVEEAPAAEENSTEEAPVSEEPTNEG